MATPCPCCGGPLLGDGATPALRSACPACLASILMGEPEAPPGDASILPASTLGGHRLVSEVARGGMGTVWRAERVLDGAVVALKLLPHAFGADPARLAQFRAEATLAARLVHPRIVAIRDIGEEGGVPFFTMDLVEGPDLGWVAGGMPMPPREAARVVREVALAVHFAHGQGVLHRDIKPTNVLLGPDGEPRVTDFGLARLLDADARLTATGETMGSPSFMAPELVSGRQPVSGVRTDVHGLGGLLYFCLTGRAPFAAESVPAALAKAMESRPVPPRAWERSVPASLEAITMRCLARDPSARYASAAAVAEDLERALMGQTIQASSGILPGGWIERVRRRGGWPGWGVAVAVVLGGGAWIAVSGQRRAAADALRESREATALARYAMDVSRAGQAATDGAGVVALGLLEAWVPAPGEPEVRGVEWFVLRRRVASLDGTVHSVQGARPAEWLAWRGWPAGAPLRRLLVSADGAWVVAGHEEGGVTWTRAWRASQPDAGPVVFPGWPVALAPDGRGVLASLPGGGLEIRRASDGTVLGASLGPVGAVAGTWEMSADGAFLAGIGPDQQVRLVHVGTGQSLPGPSRRAAGLRLSPDSNGVLLSSPQGVAWFTLRPRREVVLSTGQVASMTFDGRGKLAAVGRPDGEVLVLEPTAGRRLIGWRGHEGRVTTLAFAPDGRTLLSGGADGWLRFWNTTLWREVLRIRFPAPIEDVVPLPDGQRLAVAAAGQLHWLDTTGASAAQFAAGPGLAALWDSPVAALRLLGSGQPSSLPPEARHY